MSLVAATRATVPPVDGAAAFARFSTRVARPTSFAFRVSSVTVVTFRGVKAIEEEGEGGPRRLALTDRVA